MLAFLGVLAPGVLLGQEPPSVVDPLDTPYVVIPLVASETAPFSGLLVPEIRFRELVYHEGAMDALREKLAAERKAYQSLERLYFQVLDEAARAKPWYQSVELNRWLGFGAGVLISAMVAVGVVEVLKVAQ